MKIPEKNALLNIAKGEDYKFMVLKKIFLFNHFTCIILFMWVFLYIIAETAEADTLWVFFKCEHGWETGDSVSEECIGKVAHTGAKIRTVSRYFNAVSVDYTGDAYELELIDCVKETQPVMSCQKTPALPVEKRALTSLFAEEPGDHKLSYGVSFTQLNMLHIPHLHDLGYTGTGIIVGVLDAGFDLENTECLKNIKVSHCRNFVKGGDNVKGHDHGTWVLACLGGALENEYYGPAFGATFLLAVTEDYETEARIEEDYWLAGMEWCDSLGVDIISSSLIYNDEHDNPEEDYSQEDMNGNTSLVAQAAEIAVSRGIVVVNSAGNTGTTPWSIIGTPADAEHVIAVGAVSIPEEGAPVIAPFSLGGPTADGRIKPDVVAPGWGISIQFGKGVYLMNGTSYSAPIISGLCALLLEAHPEWTPSTIMAALKFSSLDFGVSGPDNDYGWGLPDAYLALNYVESGIEEKSSLKNREFILSQPYPNPFNPIITIKFTVQRESMVTVDIFDITGRRISRIVDNMFIPGKYQTIWNGENHASGVYFIKATASESIDIKKAVLVK